MLTHERFRRVGAERMLDASLRRVYIEADLEK